MKKILILLVAALGVSTTASAQTVKVARINAQEVMTSLPEADSVKVKVEAYAKELQEEIETMQVEYNNKLEEYNKNKATYSAVIAAQKERNLQDLGRRIQERGQTAQDDFSNVQMSLMNPILVKVQDSVKKLAKSNGVTVVFDVNDAPFYVDETTIDLTPLVIKDMGGKPVVAAAK